MAKSASSGWRELINLTGSICGILSFVLTILIPVVSSQPPLATFWVAGALFTGAFLAAATSLPLKGWAKLATRGRAISMLWIYAVSAVLLLTLQIIIALSMEAEIAWRFRSLNLFHGILIDIYQWIGFIYFVIVSGMSFCIVKWGIWYYRRSTIIAETKHNDP